MCKAVCGVAAGACGSAINVHWAKGSDISDINAKSGAQHTVTGALGLICAAMFARSVSDAPGPVLWSLYAALTALHIFANVMCMKLVALDRVNGPRMALLVNNFLDGWEHSGDEDSSKRSENSDEPKNETTTLMLDAPDTIARKEPLFFLLQRLPQPPMKMRMGVSFNDFAALSERSQSELYDMIATKSEQGEKGNTIGDTDTASEYIISVGKRWRSKHQRQHRTGVSGQTYSQRGKARKRGLRNHSIVVVFLANMSADGRARAYLHAVLLAKVLERLWENEVDQSAIISAAEAQAEDAIRKAWPAFKISATKAGWNLVGGTDIETEGYLVELSRAKADAEM